MNEIEITKQNNNTGFELGCCQIEAEATICDMYVHHKNTHMAALYQMFKSY